MKTFEIFDSEDHVSREAVASSATSLLPSETVLLVTRSGILRHTLPVALARVPVTVNQDLKALMPDRALLPKYLAYGIRAFGQQILHSCVKDGTTVQSVEFSDLKNFQIPIAPSNEQQRIADALDELLSDLDAGVEALQRAQAKLALYRASVLKGAVQGDLTAEWRKRHPDAEPAPGLLQRILVERRQRWEQEQLRKFKAAGKTPPGNWKTKYKEPVAPDTTNLPPLPKGWCWATLTMLSTTETRNGISVEGSNNPLDIPALGLEAIATPVVDLRAKRFLPIPLEIAKKYAIRRGDLFIMRGNGSRRLVGKCSVAPEPDGVIVFPDTMIRYRLVSEDVNIRWIQELWQSDLLRHQLESMAKTTAGIYKLSQDDIASVAIPLAPLAEQDCCISVLHEQSSTLDHLNSYLHRQYRANEALRQSILRHAFTGQLVPQDPNDEPASVLLERIAAEREARKKTKATPRKQPAKRQKREK